jgi:3-hydroxyacyl-[acyl-carrier-protein] dehydratase
MPTLNRKQIEKLIPHRQHMLVLHRVTDYTLGQSLVAERDIKPDDLFVQGHFEGQPIFPGVMQLEALAQAAAVLTSLTKQLDHTRAGYLFAGLSDVQFKHPVVPGQTLQVCVELLREKLGIFKFQGTASVAGNVCVTATFTAKLIVKA